MAQSTETGAGKVKWIPLESNPDVMTKYSKGLGALNGKWMDIYSFDKDYLATITQPVHSLVLLFPISEQYDKYCREQDEILKAAGHHITPDVFYMKQTIGNACGSIGIIHALSNKRELVELNGILKKFIDENLEKSPLERGKALESNEEIAGAHELSATHEANQTTAPDRDESLVTHFVAFVEKNGLLYELDGRREFPVSHGPTTTETFLKDAAAVCKTRLELDPEEYRFTLVALTNADE